jgi:hypothetical protein
MSDDLSCCKQLNTDVADYVHSKIRAAHNPGKKRTPEFPGYYTIIHTIIHGISHQTAKVLNYRRRYINMDGKIKQL